MAECAKQSILELEACLTTQLIGTRFEETGITHAITKMKIGMTPSLPAHYQDGFYGTSQLEETQFKTLKDVLILNKMK